MSEQEASRRYNEYLDEAHEVVKIGNIKMPVSVVLKECDPIAYECGFVNWCDVEDVETLKETSKIE